MVALVRQQVGVELVVVGVELEVVEEAVEYL